MRPHNRFSALTNLSTLRYGILSAGGGLATGIIQAILATQGFNQYYLQYNLSELVVPLILASVGHWEIYMNGNIISWDPSDYLSPECPTGSTEYDWFLDGMVLDQATGMTMLGISLQAVVLLTALLSILLLWWPTLPLLSEWPARWLYLVREMSQATLHEAVEGTLIRREAVKGSAWVYLSSSSNKDGSVQHLVLSSEKGLKEDFRAIEIAEERGAEF